MASLITRDKTSVALTTRAGFFDRRVRRLRDVRIDRAMYTIAPTRKLGHRMNGR
jgi:hypothetical protein